ncbi:hypothetical protein [Herbiconiux sp.]|uniref:hypothetical protein n=1 Tax=Herbiconiux sp. TaxID=1871186 RepID=UPI0025BB893A|nr:hypothetical protein [Herbiconiux sp.]
MTDADQPREISRRTITMVGAWSVPTIALAAMAPSAAASGSNLPTFTIEAVGPTPGDAVTFWVVTIQNTSRIDIPAEDLRLVVPKGTEYRIANNSTDAWIKVDSGTSFVYTHRAGVYSGASATSLTFEFKRFPPDSTGSPTVTITAIASGFQSASSALVVPY